MTYYSSAPSSISGLGAGLDPLTQAMADLNSSTLDRGLTDEVREKTRHHQIDTVAATISGSRLPAGEAALRYVCSIGGTPQASVIGSGGFRASVVNAALANAMAAHGDETDDFYTACITHSSFAAVPAALAVGGAEGRSGADLLSAVSSGFNVRCKVLVSLDCYHQFKDGRGMNALGGIFDAVAASSLMMCFSQRQVADAFLFTLQQASGLTFWRRDEACIENAFDFAGMPARNGVMSAGMVACDMPSVCDAMTGVNGLFPVNAPEGFDLAEPWSDLSTRAEVLSSSIKKWSVGSPGQAALDAVTALQDAHDLRPEDVEDVAIYLPDDVSHIVDEGGAPNVNIRHLAAICIVDRTLGFASTFDEKRLGDPVVVALRARVVPSAELTVVHLLRQAIVEIVCKHGRKWRHHARVVRRALGDLMSRVEVLDKARDLMAPVQAIACCTDIPSMLERSDEVFHLRVYAALTSD